METAQVPNERETAKEVKDYLEKVELKKFGFESTEDRCIYLEIRVWHTRMLCIDRYIIMHMMRD